MADGRETLKILGVCGSLQARSSNLALLEAARARAPADVVLTIFEGIGALPLFNPDLEADGPLPPVERWRGALSGSDDVLVASPEYGHSLSGVLKNAIDWVIGTGELERKVIAITTAVPAMDRGRMGLRALGDTLGAVRARVVGGEPIARGPSFEEDVAALVAALARAVEAARSD